MTGQRIKRDKKGRTQKEKYMEDSEHGGVMVRIANGEQAK